MGAWFQSLPIVPAGIIVVGGFVLVSVILGRLVARFVPRDLLQAHNDLTGFMFAVVGLVYAVVLGFVAIGVWERFESAAARTYDEASNLAIVYRDAGSFAEGPRIRHDLRSYVENVVVVGWSALESGMHNTPVGPTAERLAREVRLARISNPQQTALYPHMIEALDSSMLDRDARVAEDTTGLSGVMWFVVFAGGFLTIGFTYLFGFRQEVMQTAMIGTLAMLIGMVVFLTLSLDYPFRGAIHVPPEAFDRALFVFDEIDRADSVPAPSVHTR
jgi:hypothetical protein